MPHNAERRPDSLLASINVMQYKPVYTTSSLLAERKHETQRFFFFFFFLTVPEFIILLLNYVEGLSPMSLPGKDSFFISDTPPFYLKVVLSWMVDPRSWRAESISEPLRCIVQTLG